MNKEQASILSMQNNSLNCGLRKQRLDAYIDFYIAGPLATNFKLYSNPHTNNKPSKYRYSLCKQLFSSRLKRHIFKLAFSTVT